MDRKGEYYGEGVLEFMFLHCFFVVYQAVLSAGRTPTDVLGVLFFPFRAHASLYTTLALRSHVALSAFISVVLFGGQF